METLEQTSTCFETKSKTFIYDGSFNGFLTAVFIGFEQKIAHADIQPNRGIQSGLFTETETIFTNLEKAKRVWSGVQNRSSTAIKHIYFAFLSEQKGIEPLLYAYIQKLMQGGGTTSPNFKDDCKLKINQLAHKVGREKQRMEVFVRFQLTNDDIYFAIIEPDFNVLPLLSKHFRSRYADQQWIIYDAKRNYGLYYNLEGVELINLDLRDTIANSTHRNDAFVQEEHEYQGLWNNYFQSTDIKLRINKKLHTQHVPKPDWKYLSEKKVS